MKTLPITSLALVMLVSLMPLAASLVAQDIPIQANTNPITIPMIPVIIPGVANFSISQTSITPTQYCAFLNAVASRGMPADPHGLYHFEWLTDTNISCIGRDLSTNEDTMFTYHVLKGTKKLALSGEVVKNGDISLSFVSMADGARFCNWLEHGQPLGQQGDDTTETGSYTFNEVDGSGKPLLNVYKSVTPQPGARWRLPTRAEFTDLLTCYNNLDYGQKSWDWTQDSYYINQAGQNFGGYYRSTLSQVLWTDPLYFYQDTTIVNTGFRVLNTTPQ